MKTLNRLWCLILILALTVGISAPFIKNTRNIVVAQDSNNLRIAPLNPEFLNFLKDPPEVSYGYIPPTVDLGHLKNIPVQMKQPLTSLSLPSNFDWRTQGKVTSIKDQMICNACWIFSITSVLESAVMVNEDQEYDFSEQSIALGVDRSWIYLYDDPDEPCGTMPGHGGGNSLKASEVFIRKGVVLESCNVYNPSGLQCNGTCLSDSCLPVKKVTGYRYITNDESQTELIKQAVSERPVYMSFYYSPSAVYDDPTYGTVYDYYPSTETVNHSVSIIGWDDSVPHPNAAHPGNGAWLAKNEWGTGWGNDGYFWVTYDSSSMTEVVYVEYGDPNDKEALHYWDESGLVGSIGDGDNSCWMASIFTADLESELTHVDFWTTSTDTIYEIHVYDAFFGGQLGYQTGSCDEFGYYSIPLDTPILLDSGQQFTIAVEMTTPGWDYPLPVERVITGYCEPTIQTGVNFFSSDGSNWEDVASSGYNFSLRARTQEMEGEVVDLLFMPSTQTVNVGDIFDITIEVQCDSQDVSGIAAYADFDPNYLEVQSITGELTLLELELWNTHDNAVGTADYCAGTYSQPWPLGTFTIATISFKALTPTANTTLIFHNEIPRKSDADFGGYSKLHDLTGAGVTIVGNTPPVLSNGQVDPVSGDVTTDFTYSVTYTDADNDPPASPTVSIDGGLAENMTVKAGEDGDYANGETYEHTISGLTKGSHSFQFAATDGIDPATGDTDVYSGPGIDNTPPVLSNGQVSPVIGDVTTDFTYSVTYTDADNDPPTSPTVSIDGGLAQDMSVKVGEDGDYTNDETYEYTISGLTKDSHSFQFAATDGVDPATGDTDVHSGPAVANSVPIVVSVTISPDPAYTNTNLTATPSGWSDPDGDAEDYQWQWQEWNGAWVNIPGATSNSLDSTHFVKDDQVKIICTPFDGTDVGGSVEDTNTISNTSPVADAGTDQTSVVGREVALDGSSSSDIDDDSLTYLWAQESGTSVTLSDTTAVSPTFTPTIADTYTFSLIVNDGSVDSPSVEVDITVKASNNVPALSAGMLNPTSGYTTTDFTYSVVYTDDDDDAPMAITITIDAGTPQYMNVKTSEGGDYTNGETYEYAVSGSDLGLGSHTYQFAASDGIDDATGDTTLHNGPTVSSPPVTGGGGGGGGALRPIEFINKNGRIVSGAINWDGKVLGSIIAYSNDGKVSINISVGTYAKDKDGKPITKLRISPDENPPSISENTALISFVYNFEPAGATFDPPIVLTMSYDPELLPEGTIEDELYIAYWDGTQWLPLECTVDTEANTVMTTIDHFSRYAILGSLPPLSPPPPAPARFTVSPLMVTPSEVDSGDEVTILTEVANIGGSEGECTLVCSINGAIESTKQVVLAVAAVQQVEFTVMKDLVGTYEVDINGSLASFVVRDVEGVIAEVMIPEVSESTSATAGMNWWLVVYIILGVFSLGIVAFTWIIRKNRQRRSVE